MAGKQPSEIQEKVLSLLTNLEIDSFVISQLGSIPNVTQILAEIVSGKGKASAYQRQNAAYVLGRLGDPEASSALLSALDSKDQSMRLSALVALKALGPDKHARQHLAKFAQKKDIDAEEIAYAHLALGGKVGLFGEVSPRHRK
jgi:HEAT repeat protein